MNADSSTLLAAPAASDQFCHLIASGWPGTDAPSLAAPEGSVPSGQAAFLQLGALQDPAMLRRLGIGVVPCLAVQGSRGGDAICLALPDNRVDGTSWSGLAETLASVETIGQGPAVGAGAGVDPGNSAQDDHAMLGRCLSHDLCVPMRNSARLVDAVLESATLDAAARSMLEHARNAAHRCADRADSLVQLMRIARTTLSATVIDMTALCSQLLPTLVGTYPHADGIARIAAGMTLTGDLQLVTLALSHLLDNACKFSAKAALPEIRVTSHSVPGFDVIAVSDNGTGFSAVHAQALFQPFVRIHLQSEFSGEGIGLAQVRRIAKRHGGWAWADVGTSGWTRFLFALPAGVGVSHD